MCVLEGERTKRVSYPKTKTMAVPALPPGGGAPGVGIA